MWAGVTWRFQSLLSELALTKPQFSDGWTKQGGVRSCLNSHYYGEASESANSWLVGSWGKSTMIRPPRDIDVLFVLPPQVYHRFQQRLSNKQSALLQEVKGVLQATYPNTDIGGDGQVVAVDFASYKVEVVPAFPLDNNNYFICDTNGGGRYKESNVIGELAYMKNVNDEYNKNLVSLIQMMKAWQTWCSVPLKSFEIELLMIDFLRQNQFAKNGLFYYDWLVRDFFAYIWGRANSYVTAPATGELVFLGNDWQSRAESAYQRAVKACEYEKADAIQSAGEEWQKIFGPQAPLTWW